MGKAGFTKRDEQSRQKACSYTEDRSKRKGREGSLCVLLDGRS